MNELDYAILAVLLISILVGVLRGAIREMVNILGWVAGFVSAQIYAVDASRYLAEWLAEPMARHIVAWLLIFLFVLMLFSLIGSLIAGAVRKLGLGSLDRVGGAAIGALRGALVLVLLAWVAGLTTIPASSQWKQSMLSPWLERTALQAKQFLPPDLAARITFGKTRV